MSPRCFSAPLICAALAGGVVAQVPGEHQSFATGPLTDVTRTAVGDFDGDHLLDVAVLVNGEPHLVVGPDLFSNLLVLPEPAGVATDLATLPGFGPQGKDLLLVATPQGLLSYTQVGGHPLFQAVATPTPGAWTGVHRVAVAQLPGTEDHLVVGMNASGSEIWAVDARPGQGFVGHPLPSGLTPAGPVDELALLDWTAADGGVPALAVLGDGLSVRSLVSGLTHLDADGDGGETVDMAVVHHPADPQERIAWVEELGGQHSLHVVSELRGEDEPSVSLGGLAVVGLSAAHLDHLALGSSLFVSHASNGMQIILNSVAQATSGLSQSYVLSSGASFPVAPMGVDFSDNQTRGLIADFDNDGDGDLLMISEPTGEVVYAQVPYEVNEVSQMVVSRSDSFVLSSSEEQTLLWAADQLATVPAEATHLEVLVWHEDEAATALDAELIEHEWFDLSTGWPDLVPIETFETTTAFKDRYHIAARLIVVEAGERTQAFPIAVSTWTGDTAQLQAWPNPFLEDVMLALGDTLSFTNTGVAVGGVGYTPRFNPFAGGLPSSAPSSP